MRNLALVSGCKSEQESADAVFNKRPNGALTYFLLKALGDATGKTDSLKILVKKVNKNLGIARYKQEPQLEGNDVLMSASFF